MQKTLFSFFKILILAIYILALVAVLGLWASPWSRNLQNASMVLLGVHALELVFAMKHVRRYKGPLALSVVLTLLFGLLHWKPLSDQTASLSDGKVL
jgi:uncharacterized protein YhhL (DUF1145 family)|tara:strand:+ start:15808 stop:16098 length:291 start_codon:yes stop_codon:yes gene_type:complete